ncbi:MAG: hypothetical protein Q8P05_02480 [Candidatus Diapherotrites archaeon]|nr:hypothetical protein [Candidatus Diapherotrites archaeon]
MDTSGGIPFGGSGQRVRDQVLVILSEEFPLTVKELFNRISRQGHEITYQAVHKVVNQLMDEGITEKKGKGVQLSQSWIHKVKEYAFNVDTIYTKGKQYKLPRFFEKPYTIVFDDFSTYVVWIAENLRDGKFSQGKTGIVYGMFYHAPWPLRFNFSDFELLRQMATKCHAIGISACDMPFDRWVATHFKLGGVKQFKTGMKTKIKEDYYVTEDVVVRVKFSPETIAFLDKIYSKIHDLKDLFHFYLVELERKAPIHIELTAERNPMLAKMIENQIKQYLNETEKGK